LRGILQKHQPDENACFMGLLALGEAPVEGSERQDEQGKYRDGHYDTHKNRPERRNFEFLVESGIEHPLQ